MRRHGRLLSSGPGGRYEAAFVPREGASPETVIAQIHLAGGIASIAHPGLLGRDDWIAGLVAAELDALEAYHTNHDDESTSRYRAIAASHGIAVSGGSDYHADQTHGAPHPGSTSLPPDEFEQLKARIKPPRVRLKPDTTYDPAGARPRL